jgi:hypothetical protein
MHPSIQMTHGTLRTAYSALPAFPEAPGERMWYDRMRSYDDFLDAAPMFVAWIMEQVAEGSDEPERTRRQFPAMFDLCFDACGIVPPVTGAPRT